MQRCSQCGRDLRSDAEICPYCGHAVEEDEDRRRINLRWHITSMIPNVRHSRPAVGTANQSAGRAATALTTTTLVALLVATVALGIVLWPRYSDETFSANPTYLSGQIEVGKKVIFPEIVRTSSSSPPKCQVQPNDASWLTCLFSSQTHFSNNLNEFSYNIIADTHQLQTRNYRATLSLIDDGGKELHVNVVLQVVKQVLPPHLVVSPMPLDFGKQQSAQQVARTIMISNTGGKDLTWSLNTGGVSWLTFDKTRGTIGSGERPQTITARINTTNLRGSKTATARFTSNGNVVLLPVKVNVVPSESNTPTPIPPPTPVPPTPVPPTPVPPTPVPPTPVPPPPPPSLN
jgi:zinc-ribbon domain/Viral BACON domain